MQRHVVRFFFGFFGANVAQKRFEIFTHNQRIDSNLVSA